MEQIFLAENVNRSVEELLRKNDSCGIDGIFVSQYADYWKLNQEKILSSLVVGSYRPDAVQLVEVLKKNGKKRIISKYICTDRVVLDVAGLYIINILRSEWECMNRIKKHFHMFSVQMI